MTIAIIGGSGLDEIDYLENVSQLKKHTPYGEHSAPLTVGQLNNMPVVFLPRHGGAHEHPPHKVNYRANMWLLKSLNIKTIVAVNVVGGITQKMSPGTLLVPHQIIDYTSAREHTFFDGQSFINDVNDAAFDSHFFSTVSQLPVVHYIDFTQPYSEVVRQQLITFLHNESITHISDGVYGCTQGPRLETVAEISKLKKDGCDVVGMTAMPEAALARELAMDYVSLSLVVNWAPGIKEESLSMEEIYLAINSGMGKIRQLLPKLLAFFELVH